MPKRGAQLLQCRLEPLPWVLPASSLAGAHTSRSGLCQAGVSRSVGKGLAAHDLELIKAPLKVMSWGMKQGPKESPEDTAAGFIFQLFPWRKRKHLLLARGFGGPPTVPLPR